MLAKIIKNVMASAMEAEIAALYLNAQLVVEFRQTLTDMGHPQPTTQIRTDNESACGILTGTMRQKRSKAIDMRFHWLRDRVQNHKQFDIRWAPGATNFGDYPTKHHPGSHHKNVRPIFLNVPGKSPTTLQGCTKILSRGYSKVAKQQSTDTLPTIFTQLLKKMQPLLTHKLLTTLVK